MPAGRPRDKKYDRQYGAYLCGESQNSIARRLGVCNKMVSSAFRLRGFKKRSSCIAGEEDRELIRILHSTRDHTLQALATSFGYKDKRSITNIVNFQHDRAR